MTSGVIRTRKTPFLPVNAYRRICGNFRSMSSLTRLISCASVTGAAVPPTESDPRCAREVAGLERLTRARGPASSRFLAQPRQRSGKPSLSWEKNSANCSASRRILNSMRISIPHSLSRQVNFDDSTRCASSHIRIDAIWLESSPDRNAISTAYPYVSLISFIAIITILVAELLNLLLAQFCHRPRAS
jgi:hypothetical protein